MFSCIINRFRFLSPLCLWVVEQNLSCGLQRVVDQRVIDQTERGEEGLLFRIENQLLRHITLMMRDHYHLLRDKRCVVRTSYVVDVSGLLSGDHCVLRHSLATDWCAEDRRWWMPMIRVTYFVVWCFPQRDPNPVFSGESLSKWFLKTILCCSALANKKGVTDRRSW